THFAYPAYIIQWLSPGGKWQTLEYFLIDEKENTVIFSYVMATGGFYELDEVVSYDILPNTDLNSVIDEKDKNGGTQYAEGFTVYFPDDMEGANYDLSFLEYLK
ncbi:MAG: hypothetical protein J5830_01490, partial [Clostridia bacterium]|nr:hypothetical protein [Clostridia bacterium]